MINAILIDDEQAALRVLRNLIDEYCPGVTVISSHQSIPAAVDDIKLHQPDVVFCDIEMPNHSGLDLINFFEEVDFEIVFATAYSEYAIQAFEVSAIDYLLKPIQIDKLVATVDKLEQKMKLSAMIERLQVLAHNLKEKQIHKIALPVVNGLLFINTADIMLLEANGSYTQVWLKNGSKKLISKKLKFFQNTLSQKANFRRVHRSSIVNINYMKSYDKGQSLFYLENDTAVKISRDKKAEFDKYIEQIKI